MKKVVKLLTLVYLIAAFVPFGNAAAGTLFPTDLPSSDWVHFRAEGFTDPVCGVIYRLGKKVPNTMARQGFLAGQLVDYADYDLGSNVTCGVALGGVDTGCIDLDTNGLLGYCTIFNSHVPRRGPVNLPILGLSIGGKTWVLCDKNPRKSETWHQIYGSIIPVLSELKLEGVKTAKEIHYWGHYPVADLEFETDAPVSVGLRAWSPFLPGDVVDSMIPAIVFEVHLRNQSSSSQRGTIAFSFPGPDPKEAGVERFVRKKLSGGLKGIEVGGKLASYAMGVIGKEAPRLGGELGADGGAWARIAEELPAVVESQPGSSTAVDFSLASGREKVVRFVLTWYAPTWNGTGYNWGTLRQLRPADDPTWWPQDYKGTERTFTHMYAKHYPSAEETAKLVAERHSELLKRVLAWQQVIYTENKLPVWLRDSLVNVLYIITENGLWAQKKYPIPDWVREEDGLFGMNEAPRHCPQIECLATSFYGSQPIFYFFPEIELSTIRGYKGYQFEDGTPTWIFSGCTGRTPYIDFAYPTKGYQFATNGISVASIIDRFLLSNDTPDKRYLREFYPMIKKLMEWTVKLRTTPSYTIGERIISMPDNNVGTEWFEMPEPGWCGMTAHVAGLHLAQLRITERMAREYGDTQFASQCGEWIKAAQEAMEKNLWDPRGYYINFNEPDTGKRSELLFGYQLDGEWITDHEGLPSALSPEKVKSVLDLVRKCNVAISRYGGAVNYANIDGTPAQIGSEAGISYGPYSVVPTQALMLAMTYMYDGQKEFGIELARKVWHNIVCVQGFHWDAPNIMRGDIDTGERYIGYDYHMNLMLWSLPAAIEGQDVSGPSKPGGLVYRIKQAARAKNR